MKKAILYTLCSLITTSVAGCTLDNFVHDNPEMPDEPLICNPACPTGCYCQKGQCIDASTAGPCSSVDPETPNDPEIPNEPEIPIDPEIPAEPEPPIDPDEPGTCMPQCDGKTCGDDGCGGICSCGEGYECYEGICLEIPKDSLCGSGYVLDFKGLYENCLLLLGDTIVNKKICITGDVELDIQDSSYDMCHLENVEIEGHADGRMPKITIKGGSPTEGGSSTHGLFGSISNTTISNLEFTLNVDDQKKTKAHALLADELINSSLKNVKIIGDLTGSMYENTGGVVGKIENSTLENVTYQGSVNVTYDSARYVGGFAGRIISSRLTDINSHVDSVKGRDFVGGFAGAISDDVILERIVHTANSVRGRDFTGGFIGAATGNHTIQNVVNTVEKVENIDSGFLKHLGGFVGYIYALEKDEKAIYQNIKHHVKQVIATETTSCAGGFIGQIEGIGSDDAFAEYIDGQSAGKGSMSITLSQIDSRGRLNINKVEEGTKYVSYGGFIGYFYNDKFQLSIDNVFSHGVVQNVPSSLLEDERNYIGGYIGRLGSDNAFSLDSVLTTGLILMLGAPAHEYRAVLGQDVGMFKNVNINHVYYYDYAHNNSDKFIYPFTAMVRDDGELQKFLPDQVEKLQNQLNTNANGVKWKLEKIKYDLLDEEIDTPVPQI